MTSWPLYLLIAGVLLYTAGIVALTWLVFRQRRRDLYASRRRLIAERDRLQNRLVKLWGRLDACRQYHAPRRPADMSWLPDLLDEADAALAEQADSVLRRALTRRAALAYRQLVRRDREPR